MFEVVRHWIAMKEERLECGNEFGSEVQVLWPTLPPPPPPAPCAPEGPHAERDRSVRASPGGVGLTGAGAAGVSWAVLWPGRCVCVNPHPIDRPPPEFCFTTHHLLRGMGGGGGGV